MFLKSLHLVSFRNYLDQEIEFFAPKTILVGNNGMGKSNLLEAVELLATLKSHRTGRDRDLIWVGGSASKITAKLERVNGMVELGMTLRYPGRRSLSINGEPLRRMIDFLGVLNAVSFSSLDLELVRGGPEYRRHWLDLILTQLEPVYANILHEYHKVLRQRNTLLKQIKILKNEGLSFDQGLEQLTLWNDQLARLGSLVSRRRDRVIERLNPLAQVWHNEISGCSEILSISYAPSVSLDNNHPDQVKQAFLEKIELRRVAELHHATTLVGPHRDEVDFMINETPARAYGSGGQQRTLVLALKLAELKLIESVVREPPLLLLDDVLAELDPIRQGQLLETIQNSCQTLITTTHLGSFGVDWVKSSQVFVVNAGKITLDKIT